MGALGLVAIIIARADGSLAYRLCVSAFPVGGFLIILAAWVWKAPQSRAEEARIKGPVYKSWWIPRSLKMRALTCLALIFMIAVIASRAGSVQHAVQAAGEFLAFIAMLAWAGSRGNSVELQPEGLNITRMAGSARAMTQVATLIKYRSIDVIRVKKNGDFELKFLDEGKRDKVRKASFKIVPERRREFFDDLRSRVESSTSEGVTVTLERDL